MELKDDAPDHLVSDSLVCYYPRVGIHYMELKGSTGSQALRPRTMESITWS
jgi:hypothetical protein